MKHEEKAEDILVFVKSVLYPLKTFCLSGDAEMEQKIIRAFPHDRQDFFDNRLEESYPAISKTACKEAGNLNVSGVLIAARKFDRIVENPLSKVIFPIKGVESSS